jgi:predicted DNA-binding protein (MmcQ/YjbR family)
LNKRHWNSVVLDGTVPDDEVQEWIEHSYDLVVAKLPRHRREALLADHPGA